MLPLSSYFIGAWNLTRTVSGQGSMSGIAEFTGDVAGSKLNYTESGTSTLASGASLPFTRSYSYVVREGGFEVFFAEDPPRLFESVSLVEDGRALVGNAVHACDPDFYESTYRIVDAEQFHVEHRVTGPRKGYTIATSFKRNSSR